MKIEVNKSAKRYAKEEIFINASVVTVFKLISEINNWKRWQSNVEKVSIIGEPKEGTSFKCKTGVLSVVSKLHTLEPFTEIGWTGKIWWITAVHNWYFQEEENGKCKVTVEESLNGFLAGLVSKSLREGMIKNLQELKLAAEMQ